MFVLNSSSAKHSVVCLSRALSTTLSRQSVAEVQKKRHDFDAEMSELRRKWRKEYSIGTKSPQQLLAEQKEEEKRAKMIRSRDLRKEKKQARSDANNAAHEARMKLIGDAKAQEATEGLSHFQSSSNKVMLKKVYSACELNYLAYSWLSTDPESDRLAEVVQNSLRPDRVIHTDMPLMTVVTRHRRLRNKATVTANTVFNHVLEGRYAPNSRLRSVLNDEGESRGLRVKDAASE